MDEILVSRHKRISARLAVHGIIEDYEAVYLSYFDFDADTFADTYDVGCRLLILYVAAYAVEAVEDRPKIIKWLRKEGIWKHVSPNERSLLNNKVTDEKQLQNFVWGIEGAYILAWALGIIEEVPSATRDITDEEINMFISKIPKLGTPIQKFLTTLEYRNPAAIFEENLFHELATTFFRNLMFNDKPNTSDIHLYASFERHKTLNWLRRFMEIEEWDETETST